MPAAARLTGIRSQSRDHIRAASWKAQRGLASVGAPDAPDVEDQRDRSTAEASLRQLYFASRCGFEDHPGWRSGGVDAMEPLPVGGPSGDLPPRVAVGRLRRVCGLVRGPIAQLCGDM